MLDQSSHGGRRNKGSCRGMGSSSNMNVTSKASKRGKKSTAKFDSYSTKSKQTLNHKYSVKKRETPFIHEYLENIKQKVQPYSLVRGQVVNNETKKNLLIT